VCVCVCVCVCACVCVCMCVCVCVCECDGVDAETFSAVSELNGMTWRIVITP